MMNIEKVSDSKRLKEFAILEELGHGSYGRVFKIRVIQESESPEIQEQLNGEDIKIIEKKEEKNASFLTMKKFFFDKYKSSKSVVEKQLHIINNLKLLDKNSFFTPIFFEYIKSDENDTIISDFYDYNLLDIIKKKEFNSSNSEFYRSLIYYLINSLDFFHSNNIMHRDIKPDNIMINSLGEVKFIDFDLLKEVESNKDPKTKSVYTIYYRPAEILFGDTHYTYKADIWAVGCVLAEIFLKTPIFKSENEFYLLDSITNIIGLINESSFPGVSELSNYFELDEPESIQFEILMKDCDSNFKNLVSSCLNINPNKRPNCKELLNHKYFEELFTNIKMSVDNINNESILQYCKDVINKNLNK